MADTPDRANIIGLLPRWPGWSLTTPHIGFLHAALRFLGEKVTPSFVMGVSGEAFKMFVTVPPSKVCGVIEAQTFMGTALAAFGYDSESLGGSDPAEIIPAVSPFIGAGAPVLAWHVNNVPEWGAVVGYHRSRGTVITQGILTPQEELSEEKAEELVWEGGRYAMLGINEKKAAWDASIIAREALVRAVGISEGGELKIYDPYTGKETGPFITGIDAYGALIRWLEEAGEDELAAHAEWDFPYFPLVLSACRKAAGVFIREISYRFGAVVDRHLRGAGRNYGRLAEIFADMKEIFPFPGVAEDLVAGSNRIRAVEMLTAAAGVERRILSDLKSFLRH